MIIASNLHKCMQDAPPPHSPLYTWHPHKWNAINEKQKRKKRSFRVSLRRKAKSYCALTLPLSPLLQIIFHFLRALQIWKCVWVGGRGGGVRYRDRDRARERERGVNREAAIRLELLSNFSIPLAVCASPSVRVCDCVCVWLCVCLNA